MLVLRAESATAAGGRVLAGLQSLRCQLPGEGPGGAAQCGDLAAAPLPDLCHRHPAELGFVHSIHGMFCVCSTVTAASIHPL